MDPLFCSEPTRASAAVQGDRPTKRPRQRAVITFGIRSATGGNAGKLVYGSV